MPRIKHSSKSNLKRTAELRSLVANLPIQKVITPRKPVYSCSLIEEGPYAALIRDQGLSDALQGSEIAEGSDY